MPLRVVRPWPAVQAPAAGRHRPISFAEPSFDPAQAFSPLIGPAALLAARPAHDFRNESNATTSRVMKSIGLKGVVPTCGGKEREVEVGTNRTHASWDVTHSNPFSL